MRIYILGNPLLREDSIALKIAKKLSKKFPEIEFKEFDVVEDLEESENLYLMDVVKGLEEVKIIQDFDCVETKKIFSLHDYDLGYEIRLLKKIGKIKKVFLIAIPFGKDKKGVEAQVHLILKKWLAQLKQGS
ncbi:MAG: hypothetical protein QXP77_02630 [Candidatus Aenigmatarchaeota archaeon]